jgi:hypothetical protein
LLSDVCAGPVESCGGQAESDSATDAARQGGVVTTVDPMVAAAASKRGRRNRIKGRDFTGEIKRFWTATVGPVVATQQELGADDLLDVVNGLSIECKSQVSLNLAGWVKQSAEQAAARGGLVPIVVHKRSGTMDAGRYYVTMELSWFVELIARLRGVRPVRGEFELEPGVVQPPLPGVGP